MALFHFRYMIVRTGHERLAAIYARKSTTRRAFVKSGDRGPNTLGVPDGCGPALPNVCLPTDGYVAPSVGTGTRIVPHMFNMGPEWPPQEDGQEPYRPMVDPRWT